MVINTDYKFRRSNLSKIDKYFHTEDSILTSKAYYFLYSIVVIFFIFAFWPSLGMEFRAEQWPIYRHYQDLPLPKSLKELFHIMFWTPFEDYRFLPLGYLSNFLQFIIFGNNFSQHVIYSLVIYFINASLASKLVFELTSQKFSALVTFSLALLMPADSEIVSWSFFTYKQYQITFLLGSFIFLVIGLRNCAFNYLLKSIILLFISCLFYEITFPLLICYLLMFLYLGKPKQLSLLLLGLIVLYLSLNFYFQNIYFLGEMRPSYHSLQYTNLLDNLFWLVNITAVSVSNWVFNGWFLANLGFKISFYDTIKYITFDVKLYDNYFFNLMIYTSWSLILGFMILQKNYLKRDFFILICGFAVIIAPLALGRSYTNGVDYLAKFSMYNHVPNIFLSIAIGYLLATNNTAWNFIRKLQSLRIFPLIPIICLLSFSNHNATASYKNENRQDISITELINEILSEGHVISVGDDFLTRLELPNISLKNNFNQNKYELLSSSFPQSSLQPNGNNYFLLDAYFFNNVVSKELSLDETIQLNRFYLDRLLRLCAYLGKDPTAIPYYSAVTDFSLPNKNCPLVLSELTSFEETDAKFFLTRALVKDYLDSGETPENYFLETRGHKSPSSNSQSHVSHPLKYLTDGNLETTWSTISYKTQKNIMLIIPIKPSRFISGVRMQRRSIEHEAFPKTPLFYFQRDDGVWTKISSRSSSTLR